VNGGVSEVNNSLCNDFSLPAGGISSLRLPVVVVP
jgi:serine/threonine-protein phosphatase 2A regulatory subunit B